MMRTALWQCIVVVALLCCHQQYDLISHSVTLPWQWTNQSLPCHIGSKLIPDGHPNMKFWSFYLIYSLLIYIYFVVGVTKMGTTMPRTGIEPTSLPFRASVVPLHNEGSLLSPLYPAHLCVRLLASEVSASYYNIYLYFTFYFFSLYIYL